LYPNNHDDGGSLGSIATISKWYHMHVESCREHCMHTRLCEMSHTWLCEIMWTMWIIWMFVEICTSLCLSFGDIYTLEMIVIKWKWWEHILVISFNDEYFGDNDVVWIICIWLGDSFDDDDFLSILLRWWLRFIWNN